MKSCFQTSELCITYKCMYESQKWKKIERTFNDCYDLIIIYNKATLFLVIFWNFVYLYYTVNTPTSFIPHFISMKLETRRKTRKTYSFSVSLLRRLEHSTFFTWKHIYSDIRSTHWKIIFTNMLFIII